MNEIASRQAVLLDIDGTLLDSNDAHARSWIEVFAQHGKPITFERVRPLIGLGSGKLLGDLLELDEADPLAQRILKERRDVFLHRHLCHLRPTPGARALVERLISENFKVVVATAAGKEELHALLRQAGVDDLIELSTTADDVQQSKPDPEVVIAAVKKAGVALIDATMIGDTPYDIEAARAAGTCVIALRCGGGWNDAALSHADAIYQDPADLLLQWDGSPIGRRLAPAV